MATNLTNGDPPKDTQIKPITQINEEEDDQTVNPLESSKLYQKEDEALLKPEDEQSQSPMSIPDMMKQIEEAYKAFEVAEKREMSQKQKQNLYFGKRD